MQPANNKGPASLIHPAGPFPFHKRVYAMNTAELHRQSIAELARLLRSRDLTALELTEHFLKRIADHNAALQACCLVCPERARNQAEAADKLFQSGCDLGPLQGIPYLLKDLYDVKGLPTAAGTRLLAGNIATEDAFAVHRLHQAGMVFLGKTHTVQLAYSGVGINHDLGTPLNPWHPTPHVPGGSSSGSGVAVAAGLAPMAMGTDTGGSVRIPAALCGVSGLKPTFGRISCSGVYPLSQSMDSLGPLTRNAADAALVYEALTGPDPADPNTLTAPRHTPLPLLQSGLQGLRLAFAESTFWDGVDPEVEQAVRSTGSIFQDLGAEVRSIDFPEAAEARRLNPKGLVIAAEAYTNNRSLLDHHVEELDPCIARRMIQGRDIPAHEYLQSLRDWEAVRAKVLERLKDIDALLLPTTPVPARPVAEVDADLETYFQWNMTYLRNSSIGNILKLCGLSLPCGFSGTGLPIGLMLYAKPFQEATLLRVGQAYQSATPWHEAAPDIG